MKTDQHAQMDSWKAEQLSYFNEVDDFELVVESDYKKPSKTIPKSTRSKTTPTEEDDFLTEELKGQPQPTAKLSEPTNTAKPKLSVKDILYSSQPLQSLPSTLLAQLSQSNNTNTPNSVGDSLVNELDYELKYITSTDSKPKAKARAKSKSKSSK